MTSTDDMYASSAASNTVNLQHYRRETCSNLQYEYLKKVNGCHLIGNLMKILLNALPQRELVSNHMNKMAPKILHVKDENFLRKCGVEFL